MSEVIKTSSKTMVSIGMPVYNGERYIRAALESLLKQTHNNFELIVSDNSSTDNTQAIINEYIKQDKRIRYSRSNVNYGAIWNLNRVFDMAKHQYFMWASHDDYWYPNYIELCLEKFNCSNNIVMSSAESAIVNTETDEVLAIDRGLDTTNKSDKKRFILYRKYLRTFPGADCIFYGIYDHDSLKKIMPMKTVVASDHILLSSLSLLGEFNTVKDVLFHKRDGGACESLEKIAKSMCLDNKLFVMFPYIIREYFFQRIIFKSSRIGIYDKFKLVILSIIDYLDFRIFLRMKRLMTRLQIYFSFN